ncbi:hypothetical protein [uncultured Methanolobus sp.]|uniref:hypothetical protein n=1 Tax=uncultured Methanolobus sp. TaxID=218300 RepID=UPI002AAA8A2C|nr:hypothetical protein [uncultured Methanolobus sp.]
MDKGAHFYRCDFQVHTPRDINWTGKKFGVNQDKLGELDDETKKQLSNDRIQFAKEYLVKVRNAGLNAIAITDHHDVASVKIIRKVAEEENKQFTDTDQLDKVVTVYPGIELTLSNPASQCILIFDADIPDSHLDAIINFGIVN